MTVRIRRVKDGVIFTHTDVLANKKGFVAFEDDPKEEKVLSSGGDKASTEKPIDKMTRKEVGVYIKEEYGIQIPNMNRKTDEILVDAYKIIDEFTEKEVKDIEEADSKEAFDKLQKERAVRNNE